MKRLSSKYLNLEKAQAAGISTPKTLLLEGASQPDITTFIDKIGSQKEFIVRSIQAHEDGAEQSFAGHFWSSDAFVADKVFQTIERAKQENEAILKQLKLPAKPQLMLQEFIPHSVGGVLFSPWSFFSEYCYIEYSTISVQQAVEGQSQAAIFSINHKTTKSHPAPLALPDELNYLEKPLQNLCQKLDELFPFPMDCEWAFNKISNEITLLQVRPQTTQIGSVLPLSDTENTPKLNWKYSALSESLGKLSPLSFSLLEQLYKDAKPAFQSLGYSAEKVDFMRRMPDGSILTDLQREQAFYTSSTFGGFWRGFRSPKWQQNAFIFVEKWNPDSDFSYKQLSQVFQLWMLANLLSQGKGRDKISFKNAYELSWRQNQIAPEKPTKKCSWDELNPQLRKLFFYELEKLKTELKHSPEQLFNNWKEYNDQTNSPARLTHKQQQEAQQAIYDYSMIGQEFGADSSNIKSIGAKKKASGKVFIIENPSRFRQKLPDGCILIAAYFSNQWVHDIKNINAIIVNSGSQLSHSAIVARELNVPYFIAPSSITKTIKQGDQLEINQSGKISQSS